MEQLDAPMFEVAGPEGGNERAAESRVNHSGDGADLNRYERTSSRGRLIGAIEQRKLAGVVLDRGSADDQLQRFWNDWTVTGQVGHIMDLLTPVVEVRTLDDPEAELAILDFGTPVFLAALDGFHATVVSLPDMQTAANASRKFVRSAVAVWSADCDQVAVIEGAMLAVGKK